MSAITSQPWFWPALAVVVGLPLALLILNEVQGVLNRRGSAYAKPVGLLRNWLLPAAALGAELAIISNFTLNNLWTFAEKKISGLKNILWKFLHFNLTSLGAVIIQGIVVGFLARFFGDQWRQIYLIIAIGFFVVPYNYTMYNLVIWKTWRLPWKRK